MIAPLFSLVSSLAGIRWYSETRDMFFPDNSFLSSNCSGLPPTYCSLHRWWQGCLSTCEVKVKSFPSSSISSTVQARCKQMLRAYWIILWRHTRVKYYQKPSNKITMIPLMTFINIIFLLVFLCLKNNSKLATQAAFTQLIQWRILSD